MTSFKNYFNYIFKKSRSRLLITLVIALIITVSSVDVYIYDSGDFRTVSVSFGWIATIPWVHQHLTLLQFLVFSAF